jgi:hypothetical protein
MTNRPWTAESRQSGAREALYRAAEDAPHPRAPGVRLSDDDICRYIDGILAVNPEARSQAEMEVFRWLRGGSCEHQRWNHLWNSTRRARDAKIAEARAIEAAVTAATS